MNAYKANIIKHGKKFTKGGKVYFKLRTVTRKGRAYDQIVRVS